MSEVIKGRCVCGHDRARHDAGTEVCRPATLCHCPFFRQEDDISVGLREGTLKIESADAELSRLRLALAAAEKEGERLAFQWGEWEKAAHRAESSRDQMGAALREAREWVKQAGYSALGARNLLIRIDALLVDGAEDAPKAPKDPLPQSGHGDRAEKEGG